MSVDAIKLASQYIPILELDEHEPFLPQAVGVTVLDQSAPSPSFRRQIKLDPKFTMLVIEFAIYWDYDIQHLYDLEHVWVYVGKDGSVTDCEASFHGKYFKGLLPDRSNVEGQRVKLYCQAGKHAFSPLKEIFPLIPNYSTCTYEEAGEAGLIITAPFQGVIETSEQINSVVHSNLQRYRFRPSGRYSSYSIPEELLMSWEQLRQVIPTRIQEQLRLMESD
ncbi:MULTISPECIES: hypothetical protein [Paenibacillus]|uniref:hypothetical protein n=1 Tax=Paenibacillus TaxID=44249 RepID=UPI0020426371|nr:hypothetical protein [Paenibacillus camelliae]MCM3632335.1 hypothetical protein [Paenibacillus camelliae]